MKIIMQATGDLFTGFQIIIILNPLMPQPDLFDERIVLVPGGTGGLGLPVENYTWQEKNNWSTKF